MTAGHVGLECVVADDADQAAEIAASHIASVVRRALAERGRAAVALSGGSSPVPMYAHLADIDLDWSRVLVLQVDERIVATGDPDRNWDPIQRLLVGPTGASALAFTVAPTAGAAAGELLLRGDRSRLRARLGAPPMIDVVQLGLGDDGHTASWVPDREVPDDIDIAAVDTYRGHRRLTLTPRVVNAAHAIVWLVTGTSKRSPLRDLRAGHGSAPSLLVRRTGALVIADRAAAS